MCHVSAKRSIQWLHVGTCVYGILGVGLCWFTISREFIPTTHSFCYILISKCANFLWSCPVDDLHYSHSNRNLLTNWQWFEVPEMNWYCLLFPEMWWCVSTGWVSWWCVQNEGCRVHNTPKYTSVQSLIAEMVTGRLADSETWSWKLSPPTLLS